jgi:hypothetical protein
LANPATRDADARYVHLTLRDNASNLPVDYVAAMEATKTTRPHWYRSFILGEWGSFEGQAYEEFDERVHVVEPFVVPDHFERFESLDHGAANPTCVHLWVVDEDGNCYIADEYYSPGLVSAHAAAIKLRRERWCRAGQSPVCCWADPSVFAHSARSRIRVLRRFCFVGCSALVQRSALAASISTRCPNASSSVCTPVY